MDEDDRQVTVTVDREYNLSTPEVDAEGFIVANGAKTDNIEILLTGENYEQLRKVDKIVYSVELAQKEGQRMHFTTDNYFGLKVGMYIKGEVTTDALDSIGNDDDDDNDDDN